MNNVFQTILYSLITVILVSCSNNFKENETLVLKENYATVLVFISPTCPLCINYVLPLNELADKYKKLDVNFLAIYPSGTSESDITQFENEYHLSVETILDSDKQYTSYFRATITPQVFLCDSTGRVIFSGALDNWMYETGKKRSIVTEHYLDDAINAYIHHKEIRVPSVEAHGCIIE